MAISDYLLGPSTGTQGVTPTTSQYMIGNDVVNKYQYDMATRLNNLYNSGMMTDKQYRTAYSENLLGSPPVDPLQEIDQTAGRVDLIAKLREQGYEDLAQQKEKEFGFISQQATNDGLPKASGRDIQNAIDEARAAYFSAPDEQARTEAAARLQAYEKFRQTGGASGVDPFSLNQIYNPNTKTYGNMKQYGIFNLLGDSIAQYPEILAGKQLSPEAMQYIKARPGIEYLGAGVGAVANLNPIGLLGQTVGRGYGLIEPWFKPDYYPQQ